MKRTLLALLASAALLAGTAFGQSNPSFNTRNVPNYQAGNCTVGLTGATTTTYSTRVCKYVKVGRLNLLKISLLVSSLGNGSTSSITLSGIPAQATELSMCAPYWSGSAAVATTMLAYLSANANTITTVATTAAASGVTDPFAFFATNAYFECNISYISAN